MKRKIFSVLFALVVVCSLGLVTAVVGAVVNEVWVAPPPAGNDANNGTEAAPFATIQKGIGTVVSPGIVHVAAGDYNEDITLKNAVEVLGAGEASTTINGTGTGSVVTASGVGSATKLDGFTITGGNNNTTGGGGMYIVNNSSLTVSNCTFAGNSASQSGGGMRNEQSSPTVTNCTFFDNSTTFGGGGMCNDGSLSSPTVTNCTFYNNTAHSGGGMQNDLATATVTNCTFYNNTAIDGGGMHNDRSPSEVTNCIFYGNTATAPMGGDGGAMYNREASPNVVNCTFSGNWAKYYGGAMYSIFDSTPTVTNCILWGDSIKWPDYYEGPEILDFLEGVIGHDHPSTTTVTYSDVQGGYYGTGNKNTNPLFLNAAAGDYHLEFGSPCINAGNNAAVPAWLTTDFEGDDRIIGATVDMGADEFLPHEVWVDDGFTGATPGWGLTHFAAIQNGINNVAEDGTVNVADGDYFATTDNSIALGEGLGYCFVHIDRPITLVGQSRDGVIVDGSQLYNEYRSAGIWVSVNNVTVKNLTIQNFYVSDPEHYSYGLVSWEKYRNFNTAEPHVLPLSYVTAENLKVVDCQASLYFMMTEHAKVKDCTVAGSKADGIWIAMGSSYATVQGNIVTNSADHGIWVGGASWCPPVNCPNAIIIDNTINGAREGGISFVNSDGATISGNTITNVAGEDPSVGGWSVGALSLKDGCSNVEAFGNTIYNNNGSWGGYSGTGHGVGIDGIPSNINLYFNNIYGNTGDGCHNYSTVAINATNNWWGNASGPIPPGTYDSYGDEVSDNVNFEPWLLAEVNIEEVAEEILPTTYDKTLALKDGWTLISVDKALLEGDLDRAWVGTNPLVVELPDETMAFKYTYQIVDDVLTGGFVPATPADLEPLTSIYVKTKDGGGVGINYAEVGPAVIYSKELEAGWNLISVPDMKVDTKALLSPLRYVTEGTQQVVGLTTLVSQGDYNQFSDNFYEATLTDAHWSGLPVLDPFDGYWAYMEAADTFEVIP